MPLTPEPFHDIRLAIDEEWDVFLPQTNVTKYKETLSEKEELRLHNRAVNLAWRAVGVHFNRVSEFYWEVSAWNDVFNSIYNDSELLMLVNFDLMPSAVID